MKPQSNDFLACLHFPNSMRKNAPRETHKISSVFMPMALPMDTAIGDSKQSPDDIIRGVDPPVDPPVLSVAFPTAAATVASNSPASQTKRKYRVIDCGILAQFAEDIESAGGIQKCIGKHQYLNTAVLSRIDRRKLYFPPSDPDLHIALQKKCWAWQALYKAGKYEKEVLARYGVKGSNSRDFQSRSPTISDATSELLDSFANLSVQGHDNPQAPATLPDVHSPPSTNQQPMMDPHQNGKDNGTTIALPPKTSKRNPIKFWYYKNLMGLTFNLSLFVLPSGYQL